MREENEGLPWEEDYPWEKDGVQDGDDWSSIALIRVFENGAFVGHVFVIEPEKRDPKFKMAGGHRADGETPRDTVAREVLGETNINIPPKRFTYVSAKRKDWPKGHWLILFTVDIDKHEEMAWMSNANKGNEGEEPVFFSPERFADQVALDKFLFGHIERLKEKDLVDL